MDSSDPKVFAASLRHDLPTLDLHLLKPYEALEQLELFLYRCVEKDETAVRVIYGIGTGALRDIVIQHLPRILSKIYGDEPETSSRQHNRGDLSTRKVMRGLQGNKLIDKIVEESGACIVILK